MGGGGAHPFNNLGYHPQHLKIYDPESSIFLPLPIYHIKQLKVGTCELNQVQLTVVDLSQQKQHCRYRFRNCWTPS